MTVALFLFLSSKENIKFRKMRLDFGLDLVVLIFWKEVPWSFCLLPFESFYYREMSHSKLEISFVL